MGKRLDLQDLLESLDPQVKRVYFQPPADVKMEYPCIRYNLDDVATVHADDRPYFRMKRYQLVVVDSNPDSTIPDKVAELPRCEFDRYYSANNLNHYAFNLYF